MADRSDPMPPTKEIATDRDSGTPPTALSLNAAEDGFRVDGGPQDDAIDAGARTHHDGSTSNTHFTLPRELPGIPGVDVRRIVGTGSSGTVFLGRLQSPGGTLVAVKVLAAQLAGTVVEERFRREVAITKLIDSPFVVKTIASGNTDGLPYVVSAWAPGRSMTGLGPMSPRFVVAVSKQIATALTHLERASVVHRDVKPGNIVVARSGRRGLRSKLIDFGLARGPHDDETENGLLSPRQSLGSPNYLSPEQLEHPGRVDGRADLYSLGATMYELLCGRPPYVGKPRAVLVAKLRGDEPRSVMTRAPDLPRPIIRLVDTLIRPSRDDRPESAGEVLDTLDDIAAELFCDRD